MPLTGWFARKVPKSLPPHPISLETGQKSSDPSFSYDSSNKALDVTGRTPYGLEKFAKKNARSQTVQPTTSSSSRPLANDHDPHEPLRSQTAPVLQAPANDTYTPNLSGPAYHSHTTPLVGTSQVLFPEQSLRSGPESTQDARTYSTDTIRGPSPLQTNGSDPNQSSTSYPKDSYPEWNRLNDSVVATFGFGATKLRQKQDPVPLHNIFPGGTVESPTSHLKGSYSGWNRLKDSVVVNQAGSVSLC